MTSAVLCVVFGAVGAMGGEVITLYDRSSLPLSDRLPLGLQYWCLASALVVFGGALAYAYRSGDAHLSLILALQIGLSTPVILRRGRRTLPDLPPGNIV